MTLEATPLRLGRYEVVIVDESAVLTRCSARHAVVREQSIRCHNVG